MQTYCFSAHWRGRRQGQHRFRFPSTLLSLEAERVGVVQHGGATNVKLTQLLLMRFVNILRQAWSQGLEARTQEP